MKILIKTIPSFIVFLTCAITLQAMDFHSETEFPIMQEKINLLTMNRISNEEADTIKVFLQTAFTQKGDILTIGITTEIRNAIELIHWLEKIPLDNPEENILYLNIKLIAQKCADFLPKQKKLKALLTKIMNDSVYAWQEKKRKKVDPLFGQIIEKKAPSMNEPLEEEEEEEHNTKNNNNLLEKNNNQQEEPSKDEDLEEKFSTTSPQHLSNIQHLITNAKNNGKKIALVLGAKPYELDHFEFSSLGDDIFVVFLDNSATNIEKDQEIFIEGDFNNLEFLAMLQKYFTNSFDLIVPDYSVSQFMNFTTEHFSRFTSLLSQNGKMCFDYTYMSDILFISMQYPTVNAKIAAIEKPMTENYEKYKNALPRLTTYQTLPNDPFNPNKIALEKYKTIVADFCNNFMEKHPDVSFTFIDNDQFRYWTGQRNFPAAKINEAINYFVIQKQ